MVNDYYMVYNLPPFTIKNTELEEIAYQLYILLLSNDNEQEFFYCIHFLVHMALSKSLVLGKKEVNMYNIIENIGHLSTKKIPRKKFLRLQKEMYLKFTKQNTIDFNQYLKNRKTN